MGVWNEPSFLCKCLVINLNPHCYHSVSWSSNIQSGKRQKGCCMDYSYIATGVRLDEELMKILEPWDFETFLSLQVLAHQFKLSFAIIVCLLFKVPIYHQVNDRRLAVWIVVHVLLSTGLRLDKELMKVCVELTPKAHSAGTEIWKKCPGWWGRTSKERK